MDEILCPVLFSTHMHSPLSNPTMKGRGNKTGQWIVTNAFTPVCQNILQGDNAGINKQQLLVK